MLYTTPMPKFKLPAVVLLILIKDDQVLLMRRQNTGWLDGNYDLVAGHIDGHETLSAAICREAYEEVGITVETDDVGFVHLLHYVGTTEYMYVFFAADKWAGTPSIKEPGKCDDLRWFSLSELPNNIATVTKDVLAKYQKGKHYTELLAE